MKWELTQTQLLLWSCTPSVAQSSFPGRLSLQPMLNLLAMPLHLMILLTCCNFNIDGSYNLIAESSYSSSMLPTSDCCQTRSSSRNTPQVFMQLSQINSAEKVNMSRRTWSRPATFLPKHKTALTGNCLSLEFVIRMQCHGSK